MNIMGKVSTFIDDQGNAYEISNHNKRASFVERRQGPPDVSRSIKSYETVNGYNCGVKNLLVNGKLAGKSYWYLPFRLQIKYEYTLGDLQTVREM